MSSDVNQESLFLPEKPKALGLPRTTYEPVIENPILLDRLGEELLLCFQDLDGPHTIKVAYGDIVKIVNALRDYSRLLVMVCDEWNLIGFHRATYELQAVKNREIADALQAGIGYDYDAAMEKCRKNKGKKVRDDDVGEDALALAFKQTSVQEDGQPERQSEAAVPAWADEPT